MITGCDVGNHQLNRSRPFNNLDMSQPRLFSQQLTVTNGSNCSRAEARIQRLKVGPARVQTSAAYIMFIQNIDKEMMLW